MSHGTHGRPRRASRGRKAAVLLCALLAFPCVLSAADRNTTPLHDTLLAEARRTVLSRTAFQADSLAVEFSAVSLAGLPEGCTFALGDTGSGARGVLGVTAEHAGRVLKRFSLGWRLHSFHRLPVAARELPREHVLARTDLNLQLVETTNLEPGDLVDCDTLEGQKLKRRVAAGTPILDHLVVPVPAVQRNQLLTLWYRGDGVEVRLPARAQQSACIGQAVSVCLEDSGRRLTALLIGPGLAVVEVQK